MYSRYSNSWVRARNRHGIAVRLCGLEGLSSALPCSEGASASLKARPLRPHRHLPAMRSPTVSSSDMTSPYDHLRSNVPSSSWDVLPCAERARIYANRIQFSKQYIWFYLAAILLNTWLLIWTVVERDYPLAHSLKFVVFVLTDCVVTLFVLFEIAISLLSQGPRIFCSQCNNRIDVCVASLCIVALALHALGETAEVEWEDATEAVVLVVRYAAQLSRLLLIVKNFRRQTGKKELDVHLDLHSAQAGFAEGFAEGGAQGADTPTSNTPRSSSEHASEAVILRMGEVGSLPQSPPAAPATATLHVPAMHVE